MAFHNICKLKSFIKLFSTQDIGPGHSDLFVFSPSGWFETKRWSHIFLQFQWAALTEQDHQRWGYSTVTHLEQPVYLAKWKNLNKEKRKEHRKKIEQ